MEKVKVRKEKLLVFALLAFFLLLNANRFINMTKGKGSAIPERDIPRQLVESQIQPSKTIPPRVVSPKELLSEPRDTFKRDPLEIPAQIVSRSTQPSTKLGEVPIEKVKLDSEIIASLGLSLEGIVWETEIPQVIINGEVLKIGDSISKVEIKDIQKGGVVLLYEGRELSITLQR